MLLRMLPEQVAEHWDRIVPAVEAAMPYGVYFNDTYKTNILNGLLAGTMHCWLLASENDSGEPTGVKALAITTIFRDPGDAKSLFIYALYGYAPITPDEWTDATTTLGKWAERQGCIDILAYTDNANSGVLRLVGILGGDASRVIIRIPINTNGRQ